MEKKGTYQIKVGPYTYEIDRATGKRVLIRTEVFTPVRFEKTKKGWRTPKENE